MFATNTYLLINLIKFLYNFYKRIVLTFAFFYDDCNLLLRMAPSSPTFLSFKAQRSLRRTFSIFTPRTNSDEPFGEQLVAERFDQRLSSTNFFPSPDTRKKLTTDRRADHFHAAIPIFYSTNYNVILQSPRECRVPPNNIRRPRRIRVIFSVNSFSSRIFLLQYFSVTTSIHKTNLATNKSFVLLTIKKIHQCVCVFRIHEQF